MFSVTKLDTISYTLRQNKKIIKMFSNVGVIYAPEFLTQ